MIGPVDYSDPTYLVLFSVFDCTSQVEWFFSILDGLFWPLWGENSLLPHPVQSTNISVLCASTSANSATPCTPVERSPSGRTKKKKTLQIPRAEREKRFFLRLKN